MANLLSSSIRYLEEKASAPEEFSEVERLVLDAINQKVAAAQDLADVMNFVFDATRRIFPCDRIGVAFLEENGTRVISHWTRALYEPVLLDKGYAQDLRGSSLARIIETGRPRIINDLERYLEEHPASASTRLILEEGVRASMTCPLVVEGRPVGFMFRSCRRPNVYTDHFVQLHMAIAERLSQAVEKTWRIEQLAAANRNYSEMLAFVSHELKSPLAVLVMDAEMLRRDFLGPLLPKQSEKLDSMIDKAKHLISLIDDYLDLAQIESGEMRLNLKTVDFADEVADPALKVIRTVMDIQQTSIKLDFPDRPLSIECDPALLTIALVNLLGNAVKYGAALTGEEKGRIRVSLSRTEGSQESGPNVRVSVWNSGPGFSAEAYPKLFRKFSRLTSPVLLKQKGSGVGLYTAWRIVQMHGGKIWARSQEGAWAEFIFEIPQWPGFSKTGAE